MVGERVYDWWEGIWLTEECMYARGCMVGGRVYDWWEGIWLVKECMYTRGYMVDGRVYVCVRVYGW